MLAPIGSAIARIGAVFGVVIDGILGWQQRAVERNALGAMDDRMLRDVGLTRAEAMVETDKPFWKA